VTDTFAAWSKGHYLSNSIKVFGKPEDRKRLQEIEESLQGKSPLLSIMAETAGKPEAVPQEQRFSIAEHREYEDLQEKKRAAQAEPSGRAGGQEHVTCGLVARLTPIRIGNNMCSEKRCSAPVRTSKGPRTYTYHGSQSGVLPDSSAGKPG